MANDHIKSAYEIAMEKLASIEEPTEDELREFRRKEYEPKGKAIAAKYLEGRMKISEIETSLREYSGEPRSIIINACLEYFAEALSLDNLENGLRAIDGSAIVKPTLDLSNLKLIFRDIAQEYENLQQANLSEINMKAMAELEVAGISGSAVKPVLTSSEAWQETKSRITAELNPKIEQLQRAISNSPA